MMTYTAYFVLFKLGKDNLKVKVKKNCYVKFSINVLKLNYCILNIFSFIIIDNIIFIKYKKEKIYYNKIEK